MLSDVYLYLHSRHTGRTYFYYFDWRSSATIYLYSMEDPDKPPPAPKRPDEKPASDTMTYIAADRGLDFAFESLDSRRPAPKYILIPELTEAMRHGTPEPPELEPTQFFILKSCAGS